MISKLLTVDGGDDYWKLVSDGSFDQVKSRPEVHEELQETFYFKHRTDVSRVIFLGTPHHGSKLSPSFVARESLHFVRLPQTLMDAATEIWRKRIRILKMQQLPTSVDLLNPDSPALAVLAGEHNQQVHYHSVIGVAPKSKVSLAYLLTGDDTPGDEVVPYSCPHRRRRFRVDRAGLALHGAPASAGRPRSPPHPDGTRKRSEMTNDPPIDPAMTKEVLIPNRQ